MVYFRIGNIHINTNARPIYEETPQGMRVFIPFGKMFFEFWQPYHADKPSFVRLRCNGRVILKGRPSEFRC